MDRNSIVQWIMRYGSRKFIAIGLGTYVITSMQSGQDDWKMMIIAFIVGIYVVSETILDLYRYSQGADPNKTIDQLKETTDEP